MVDVSCYAFTAASFLFLEIDMSKKEVIVNYSAKDALLLTLAIIAIEHLKQVEADFNSWLASALMFFIVFLLASFLIVAFDIALYLVKKVKGD